MDLRHTARVIAASESHKGAIVITVTDDGVRIGIAGLGPDEVRYALCAAINYSFVFDGDAEADDDAGESDESDDFSGGSEPQRDDDDLSMDDPD